ncbi:MAG: hypothetical protein KF752_20285 [Pirellulaceae bacterium]|nr:hypothetical protein [Pirellulaceae bacterium]
MMWLVLVAGWAVAIALAAHFIVAKCWFLSSSWLGWPMLIANAIYETVEIRGRLPRMKQDVFIFVVLTAGFTLLGGPWFGLAFVLVGGTAWLGSQIVDMQWRLDVPATQLASVGGRVPLPIPCYIAWLKGPVVERRSSLYELGHWPQGLTQAFELWILNPGTVRPQLPLSIRIESSTTSITVERTNQVDVCPEPSQVVCQQFRLSAAQAGRGGRVTIEIVHGDRVWSRTLNLSGIVPAEQVQIRSAQINRWKYGCQGGFVWRGDHDLYDPSTFQSEEGLKKALGLAARYRMPTTVMLSTGLNLDQQTHRAFCEKFGWNRHSEEIPAFIEFMRRDIDMTNEQDFPTSMDKPFSAEIGNHMHLHYGTHAAADAGNNWKSHARMGDGNYPWLQKYPCSSLDEQRDNMLKCDKMIQQHLGVKTTCFTVPSDAWDEFTPQAVEAAGIPVSVETAMSKLAKLLFFPREHHPAGCESLAEMTRMLPRDPVNGAQIAMLKFWVGVARRRRQALVFLAHHHLVMYQSNACYNLTSELMRHVLADTEGDVYPGTLTAMGLYWRDVLSQRTRKVQLEVRGREVVAHNSGERPLSGLPVEICLADGRHWMQLVDIAPQSSVRL